jgi:hypothetical protein
LKRQSREASVKQRGGVLNRALVAAFVIAMAALSVRPASGTPLLLQAATFQLDGVSYGSAPDGSSYAANVPPGALGPVRK